jgi:hypothetical protein
MSTLIAHSTSSEISDFVFYINRQSTRISLFFHGDKANVREVTQRADRYRQMARATSSSARRASASAG